MSWWTTNKQLRADIKTERAKVVSLLARLDNVERSLARSHAAQALLQRTVDAYKADANLRMQANKPRSVTPSRVVPNPSWASPRPPKARDTETKESGSTDFLTGAVVGMIANEIFSSSSSSSSSDYSSSDSGVSSGGGGDFGGGGASGEY